MPINLRQVQVQMLKSVRQIQVGTENVLKADLNHEALVEWIYHMLNLSAIFYHLTPTIKYYPVPNSAPLHAHGVPFLILEFNKPLINTLFNLLCINVKSTAVS